MAVNDPFIDPEYAVSRSRFVLEVEDSDLPHERRPADAALLFH